MHKEALMIAVKACGAPYYSTTWLGPKGYPENADTGRCRFTGFPDMFRLHGHSLRQT